MVYEIEKRSLLSKKQFETLKNYLDKNAKFNNQTDIKSFLFQKPNFLRIRLIKDNDIIIITTKSGNYNDIARKETNIKIKKNEFDNCLKKLIEQGYNKCSLLNTKRITYEIEKIKVELNEIDYFGLIVEVEATTEDKGKINELKQEVINIMNKLNLKELPSNTYQEMMNKMYSKTLKSVNEQNFSF